MRDVQQAGLQAAIREKMGGVQGIVTADSAFITWASPRSILGNEFGPGFGAPEHQPCLLMVQEMEDVGQWSFSEVLVQVRF